MLEFTLLLTFPALMALAGSLDLLTMTIPNRISLALIATFPLAAAYAGIGWTQLAMHAGAGVLMLVIGILMFTRGWLGGGDAKLLAAAALWLGFEGLPAYLMLVGVLGGGLALLILFYRSLAPPVWTYNQAWAARLHDKQGGIPYGVALAGAGLWIYPTTPWFVGLSS